MKKLKNFGICFEYIDKKEIIIFILFILLLISNIFLIDLTKKLNQHIDNLCSDDFKIIEKCGCIPETWEKMQTIENEKKEETNGKFRE